MKILILCTGNSCRSQMAAGFLQSYDPGLHVFSAGTEQAQEVNPYAVMAMKETFIDISRNTPKSIDTFVHEDFDFVITVCDNAKESCLVFTGNVKKRLHIGFEDPADAIGTKEEILSVYRRIRDEIKNDFYIFYKQNIKK